MNPKPALPNPSRRDFLKLCGGALGFSLLQTVRQPIHAAAQAVDWINTAGEDPQVEFAGMTYRGTVNGWILVSKNSGRTWETVTHLHTQCAVSHLTVMDGELVAGLEFHGHRFELYSLDGQTWKSRS